ncbi:MAG: Raf kinase inhibitor-like YbhB/YbcL family protein [Haloarculaceae archaeon]|jgi:Raf kinase inhibitor-like YbhB/YbcL family protein
MGRRNVLRAIGVTFAGGVAGCSQRRTGSKQAFETASPALESGGTLPVRFTCDGRGLSPPLRIERVPDPIETIAVTAKFVGGPFNNPLFWTLWNVPPETDLIPAGLPRTTTVESLDGAQQATRPGGTVGYAPPCPPEGQENEHWFQVHALDERLSVEAGATHETASDAIQSATVASNRITVRYTRPHTDCCQS